MKGGALAILGVGTALPPHRVSQSEARELAEGLAARSGRRRASASVLYRRSGISTRYSVLDPDDVRGWFGAGAPGASPDCVSPEETLGPGTEERMRLYRQRAGPLIIRAARAALLDAGVEPGGINRLITVSCTGFSAPGVDVELMEALGLDPGTRRTHIGFMGCHGALNGLRVARAFCGSDPGARLLLCAVELCSLHYQRREERRRLIGNALFADGAAALVGAPAGSAVDGPWTASADGSCLFPGSREAMTWTIGDHGFEMALERTIPDLIRIHLRGWLEGWLATEGLRPEEVASWAIHPGGPRILSAVERSLGLDPAAIRASRQVLEECGNMSSPTVLFILERLRAAGAPRPCLALGFGPGLAVEGALFT